MFKIGIIGCGKITQVRHLPEYKDNEYAEIAAYYDINKERAEGLASEYGGVVYNSYEEILNNPEIDAVSVCAANIAHSEITIAALKAGKHVLCEKPMAMTLKECEDMAATAKETGKFLMIGHNQRLAKAHARARQIIKDGIIGDIITFRTTFVHSGPENWSIDTGKNTWFFDKKMAIMGATADLGIHKTDLIQFLTGQTIVETTAFIGTLDKKDASGNLIGVDDNAICMYKLSGGAMGTMTAGWTCYGKEDNSTFIYGTKGVLKIYSDPKYSIILETEDGETVYYDIDKIQTNDNQTKSGVIDLFIESLVNNTEPEINGDEAMRAMRAIFASLESARTGKTVKII